MTLRAEDAAVVADWWREVVATGTLPAGVEPVVGRLVRQVGRAQLPSGPVFVKVMAFPRRAHSDPASLWLRTLIAGIAGQLPRAIGLSPRHLRPCVAGAVVYEQELPAGVGLRAHAGNALFEEPLRIEKRNHDGDLGNGHGRQRRRATRRPSPTGWYRRSGGRHRKAARQSPARARLAIRSSRRSP